MLAADGYNLRWRPTDSRGLPHLSSLAVDEVIFGGVAVLVHHRGAARVYLRLLNVPRDVLTACSYWREGCSPNVSAGW